MSYANLTAQQRLNLANVLAKTEALVRNNIQAKPANYLTDIDAALAAAKSAVDTAVSA